MFQQYTHQQIFVNLENTVLKICPIAINHLKVFFFLFGYATFQLDYRVDILSPQINILSKIGLTFYLFSWRYRYLWGRR